MSPLCCNNCFMGYQWISPFTHKQHSIVMFFLPRLGDSKGGPLPLVFQKFVEPRSIQIQMITEAAEHEAIKKLTSPDLARKGWGLQLSPKKQTFETFHLPTLLAVFNQGPDASEGQLVIAEKVEEHRGTTWVTHPLGWRKAQAPWWWDALRVCPNWVAWPRWNSCIFSWGIRAISWFCINPQIIPRKVAVGVFCRQETKSVICFNFLSPLRESWIP